jgi:predicted metal-dependent hydrolase
MPGKQTISDLPEVNYTRSARAKYQRITVRRDKTVLVTIPKGGCLEDAEKFVHEKIAWIKKQLAKTDESEGIKELPDLDIDLETAQNRLFERLKHFSGKYGMPFRKLTFRCQKTRWGSCSSKKNINLNVNICFLPKELQDYLLLHELVHTKIMNHSKQYWALLDKCVGGNARALGKELKKYRMKIRH